MTTKAAPKAAASKAAPKAEVVEFPTFDMPDTVREMAEKGVAQAKDAYDKYKSMAEDMTDMLEDNFQSASKNATEVNKKVLAAAKGTMVASFDFAEKVMAAKSFAEVIELQTAFAREQFEAAQAQARDFQELTQKAAEEAAAPVKDSMAKAMESFKIAS
ncbi:MAG: phasin [Pseudomonadota bacterium]